MVTKLSRMFSENTESALEELRAALEEGDAEGMGRLAHALKGSSATMGAQKMSVVCLELQKAGETGNLSHAPALLGQLEEEFGRVRPALVRVSQDKKMGSS